MNEPPPPTLVVFGLDPDGNPRAAKFTAESAKLANKTASLLGYRVALVGDPLIVTRLKQGNVFARGHGFIGARPPGCIRQNCRPLGQDSQNLCAK
jgi:hypothetical protein